MFPCEMKEQTAQPTLVIRFRSPVQDLPKHFGRVYGEIIQYLNALGAQHAGAPFAAYHNMDMQDLDIEAGFPVSTSLPGKEEIRAGYIPSGTYAICHYTGPYEGVSTAYDQLMKFIGEHGYTPSGMCYEWYLNGPETPPQDLKTDLTFPVIHIGEKQGM